MNKNFQTSTTSALINNKDPYILVIDGISDLLMITAVNLKTSKQISKFPSNSVNIFAENMNGLFGGDLKGVILTICHLKLAAFPNQYEVIKAIREPFEKKNIPVYNCIKKRFIWTMCLVAANITLEIGEELLIIMPVPEKIAMTRIAFTKDGYMLLEDGAFNIPGNLDIVRLLALELAESHGKKIILTSMYYDQDVSDEMKKIFETNKTINVDPRKYMAESAIAMYKWFNNRCDLKYSIIPACEYQHHFGFKFGGEDYPLITAKYKTPLPYTQTVELPRSSLVFYIAYEDNQTGKKEYTNVISMKNAAHRRLITFTLNKEYLPEYSAKPIILDPIKSLPETLINGQRAIPIIAFFDNSSVICVWSDEINQYQFLDTWNGIYGYELLIAFNIDKPCYGAEAAAAMREKPTFVVSDLLNIIAKSTKKPFHPYGFGVTKDDDHPVLLECDTHDNTRKAASPGFLLAMLFKEHKRLIKEKTGIKPSKLGFCLPLMKEKKERMTLINAIEEAFKLVSVDSFFIEI